MSLKRKRPLPDSNRGWRICNPQPDEHNLLPDNTSGDTSPRPDRALTKTPPETPSTDPDLARLVEAWPILSTPIRAAVLALVQSATGGACSVPAAPGRVENTAGGPKGG